MCYLGGGVDMGRHTKDCQCMKCQDKRAGIIKEKEVVPNGTGTGN
jgi:hypothetical protein